MCIYQDSVLYLPAIILWIIICLFLFIKKKKEFKQIILDSLFYIYIMLVLGTTLFPIQNFPMTFPAGHNFIPFFTIKQLITSLPPSIAFKQIAGNLIMFIPFGFLIPFFTKKKPFAKCMYLASSFSILIEFLQFILGVTFVGSQYRTVDIDDVILNFIGAIIGYAVYKIMPDKIKELFTPKPKDDKNKQKDEKTA